MSTIDHVSERLITYYRKAYRQGHALEYEYTFLECRKAVELILITLCEQHEIKVDHRERQIEKLIGLFKGKLPRVVEASIRLVQSLGNYGSHHQKAIERETDKLFIELCIVATRSLIQWLYPDIDLDQVETAELAANAQLNITEPNQTNKTLRVRLREYVESNYQMGESFKIGELKDAFQKLNPDNSPNTIHAYTCFMTTNYPSRLSHQFYTDGSDDLLFRVSRGIYRRYDPKKDPYPLYPEKNPIKAAHSSSVNVSQEQESGSPKKTLRVRLREYVESNYQMGEEFKIGELKEAFQKLNPNNSPNAIHGHTCFMTTNFPSRLSHHIKTDGSDDLLFRVSRGIYRRYDPRTDPTPIYND